MTLSHFGAVVRIGKSQRSCSPTLRNTGEGWATIGPTLPVGWWNRIDNDGIWAEVHGYRNRYIQTIALIRALDKIGYHPALPTAIQLRDFWRSWQQLNDPSGLNGLADEADQLAKHLQSLSSETGER